MNRVVSFRSPRLLLLGCLVIAGSLASPLLAADRHVYLDTDGDGILNDCPNPAHNAKGTSNTDKLQFCQGGASSGRIIGTQSGRVAAASCQSGGGQVSDLRNGSVADVDGDGAPEPVYGHPQACVYNMAKSDSCEVHAGTYRASGAQCDQNCGDDSVGRGTYLTCDLYDCFFTSVAAFGYGPNLDGTGYGTPSAPGYMRGAVMNGATDTWDPNGDKDPADGSYPAILSGDRDNDGAFDTTSCTGSSCEGDAFHMVMIGCGGKGSGSYGSILCSTTFNANEEGVRIDTDANGSFDVEVGRAGPKSVDNFIVKNIEFRRYNGGSGTPPDGSARFDDGSITLNADGAGDGLILDHIYLHDNDYTLALGETQWAHITDHRNTGCSKSTEIKNSYLVQNNEKMVVSDWQVNDDGGCGLNLHDNRVLIDVNSPRARPDNVVFAYLKPIHKLETREKVHRIWNNEFIYKSPRGAFLIDLQGFGDAEGNGQLWIYGNLFRAASDMTGSLQGIFSGFCGAGTGLYDFFLFNNTFDLDEPVGQICGSPGALVVEKNNAFLRSTSLYQSSATTVRRSHNSSSLLGTDRPVWFANTSGLIPTAMNGSSSYAAKSLGPLDVKGTCDPDGDGVAGVDYNGDGVNDTSWRDLANNLVSCPATTSLIDVGAIQSAVGGGPVPVCGNGLLESGEACDDANTSIGDGCGAACTVESGYTCTGQPSSCQGQQQVTCSGRANYGQSCTSGVGQCAGQGTYTCSDPWSTTETPRCSATPLAAGTEVCNNGVDENCNGMSDDACGCGNNVTISDVRSVSGRSYATACLAEGDKPHTDRVYTIVSMPQSHRNRNWVKTPNDDKMQTDPCAVSFRTNKAAVFSIGYDSRLGGIPYWLTEWAWIGEQIVSTDYNGATLAYDLYEKEIPAGTVCIGGNEASSTYAHSYIVLANGTVDPGQMTCADKLPYDLTCSLGTGMCARGGSYACTNPTSTTEEPYCDALAAQPVQETCGNGLDENCNGMQDDACSCGNVDITAIQSVSGRVYQQACLTTGQKLHTDRDYTLVNTPSGYTSRSWIKTPNDDKGQTDPCTLSFTINTNATLTVGYDERYHPPSWLTSWSWVGKQVVSTEVGGLVLGYDLYEKSFAAGRVCLGGNGQSTSAHNYIVIAKSLP